MLSPDCLPIALTACGVCVVQCVSLQQALARSQHGTHTDAAEREKPRPALTAGPSRLLPAARAQCNVSPYNRHRHTDTHTHTHTHNVTAIQMLLSATALTYPLHAEEASVVRVLPVWRKAAQLIRATLGTSRSLSARCACV